MDHGDDDDTAVDCGLRAIIYRQLAETATQALPQVVDDIVGDSDEDSDPDRTAIRIGQRSGRGDKRERHCSRQ